MGGGASGSWKDWEKSVGLSGKRQTGENQVLFEPLAHDSSLPCLDVVFTVALSTAVWPCPLQQPRVTKEPRKLSSLWDGLSFCCV